MKTRTPDEIASLKKDLYDDLQAGRITIGEATRKMRKIIGMTQSEYAEKIVGVYPRVLMQIERGKANPRLDTLNKIAKPFGLKVGFVRKENRG